jgi:Zn-dependent peptidase ImmA (M78 family)/transcriptional regulator with XRE-family HTH domain
LFAIELHLADFAPLRYFAFPKNMTIDLQPRLLEWARNRARLTEEVLAEKMGVKVEKVAEWEKSGHLTLKQAEKLAKVTHTAFGYLFLPEPPDEKLPIPDFRTVGSRPAARPSPDLLDVIYQSQRRQEWFREYLITEEHSELDLVGSTPVGSSVKAAAAAIRRQVGFHPANSRESTLDGVLREFCEAVEAAGILVVRAGIVGNNTRRKLDTEEFRGFALVDSLAPLVFVNAADFKAAQIFTLAHELAHVWAGESALSNLENTLVPETQKVEWFCNAVAAEYLVPLDGLRAQLKKLTGSPEQVVDSLRRQYRVSELVIIRRLYDAGAISVAQFKKWYEDRIEAYRKEPQSSGGDFYKNQPNKVGRRFASALIASTLEGKTLYRDAMALLDMKKSATFHEFARTLKFSV